MDTIDQIIAFVESPITDLIIKGTLIYLAVLWFAVVVWVARDIINRSNNILFQVSMILLNIGLPVFGLILYMILRPSRTLLEKYYDELEYGFLAEHSLHDESCPRCEKNISPDYLFCPNCSEKVKNSCSGCKNVFLNKYIVCPYCGRKEGAKGIKERGRKRDKGKETAKAV